MSTKAPLTQEQCDRLNEFQDSGQFHPFTCGGNRHDAAHTKYQAEHGGDFGQLVATAAGWICPVPGCGYTQDVDPTWLDTFSLGLLAALAAAFCEQGV